MLTDLQQRDYLTEGDGLITYDRSTGLEWLDVTFTQGLSMLEVEAIASLWADGWQWATIDQMESMFDHAAYTDAYEEPMIAYPIAQLLGPTVTSNEPGEHIIKRTMGYSRNFLFDTELYDYGHDYSTAVIMGAINLDTSYSSYPHLPFPLCDGEECADWRPPGWKETDTDPNYGAWLVREASAAAAPEPPVLSFKVTGKKVKGSRARKKS